MQTTWKQQAAPEEKLFLEKMLESCTRAEKQNRCITTDFYDKNWMEEVIQKYLGINKLEQLVFFGGYEEADRQCIVFNQQDYEPYPLEVSALKIEVKTGLGKTLTHRDYLGALLGLGIERSKIGDILIQPFGAIVVIRQELTTFVETHLTQIGKYQKIVIELIDYDAIQPEAKQVKEISGTVAALRADAVFALAFGVSRTTVVKLLQLDKGKKNNRHVGSTDLVKAGDVLTLKGYGKAKCLAICGQTKKDRIHIKIQKYI